MLKNLMTAVFLVMAMLLMLMAIDVRLDAKHQANYMICSMFLFILLIFINKLWR
jgi:hypothetical protein